MKAIGPWLSSLPIFLCIKSVYDDNKQRKGKK